MSLSPNRLCIIEEVDYPGLLKEADCRFCNSKNTPFQTGLDMEDADERQASESACGCSTLASKPHYKSFKFIDNSQEIRGSDGDKRTTLELHGQNGEAEARNQPGVDSRMDTVHHDGAEYPTSLGELEESKGRRKIYIKNNVMDSDMPEMVAFFQDSSHHFVKDIFMDGEVHYKKENCSVENCQLDHNSISSILNFEVESSSASTIGTQDSVPSISKESKFMADDDFHDLLIDQRGLKMSMKDFDGEEDVSWFKMNVHGSHWVKKEVPSKDAVLPNSIVLSTTEAVYYDYPTSTAASFRSEEDNIISNTEADCEQTIETKTMPGPEDGMSGNVTSWSQSFSNENVQGESTSFAVEPPPGLTKNSVPDQLYCGSVSLASSGSTASSHSFAFPILPSEWAGSPERMASSDQRQLQRHQRWRIRFLCCKF